MIPPAGLTHYRSFACLVGVALLYLLAAKVGLSFAVVGNTVTLVWPPSGIALAAILIFGQRCAFSIICAAFLANALTGLPLTLAAVIAVGNTLEASTGAWLLQRVAGFQCTMNRRRDVFAFIGMAAAFSTTISAAIGVTTLTWGGQIGQHDYASVLLKWWLGDMMGVLVVAPPLLVLLSRPLPRFSAIGAGEALALFTTLSLFGHEIFGTSELAGRGYYPAALAIFPFVIWGALRFDHWGATLTTLLVAMVAIAGTTQGTGPFAAESSVDSLVRWCSFVNVVAVTALLLAATNAEQRRMTLDLQASHDELERRVRKRTSELVSTNAGLQREIAERRRLEGELIRVSEEQQKLISRELHDGLGQHLTSTALLGAALQQRLAERGAPEADAAGRIVGLVDQATSMTQTIARGLYPATLESEGIAATLAQLAQSTQSLQTVSCSFSSTPDIRISDPLLAINLYRVAQEAINNALKHSQATHIWTELSSLDGGYRLSISDDGIGIDLDKLERANGLGMHNLRYRASLLGGSLAIERNSRGGTTLTVVQPSRTYLAGTELPERRISIDDRRRRGNRH